MEQFCLCYQEHKLLVRAAWSQGKEMGRRPEAATTFTPTGNDTQSLKRGIQIMINIMALPLWFIAANTNLLLPQAAQNK